MTEPLSKTSAPAAAADAGANASLFSEIRRTVALYWSSAERKRLLMLAAGVFMVIAATAHMQVRLNAWNQPFYDALTHKDVPEFIRQLGIFAVLAAILLTLNVAQVWLNQTTRLILRRSLVHDMLNQWLKPLRAFRLSNAGSIGANPDQRMSADAQHLADLVTDLLIGLLQSTLLLLSFTGVLWFLSQQMVLPWRGGHIQVPGYLETPRSIGRCAALPSESLAPEWATISHSTVVHHAPAERRPIPTEPMGMADRAAERLQSECDRKCTRERARPPLRSQARDQAAWRVDNETPAIPMVQVSPGLRTVGSCRSPFPGRHESRRRPSASIETRRAYLCSYAVTCTML